MLVRTVGVVPDRSFFLRLGLYKTFEIVRGYALMFRLDAFNVFNQTTWGFPDNDFNSSTFMRLAGTNVNYTPRVLQAGVRFIY